MTEKKIETSDLAKALQTLQDLAKGHASRGTATTAVEGMTGVSGATQVFHTASNSDPGTHAGSTWENQDWSDSIGPDGTDYKAAGAAMRKSVIEKVSKGQALSQGERNFVAKGGLELFKSEKAEKDEKSDKKQDEALIDSKLSKFEDKDEEKDKKLFEPKKGKSDMNKSFLDHAAENTTLREGFEVSEFLAGFAQVMHKSMSSVESRITDRVLTAIAASSADQGEVSKSLAEALASLGEVLSVHQQRIDQVDAGASRAPKSQLTKSIDDSAPETLSKSQVSGALLDLVTKGQATQMDVLKYDSTGELNNDLRAKIVGRR